MKNGVRSNVYEGEIQAKKVKNEGEKIEEKKKKGKRRKKKRRRDSLDPGGSGLSHFEGDVPKF